MMQSWQFADGEASDERASATARDEAEAHADQAQCRTSEAVGMGLTLAQKLDQLTDDEYNYIEELVDGYLKARRRR